MGTSERYHRFRRRARRPQQPSKQGEAFRKKLAEERQGSPTKRKYLSEPPLDYRQAAATAPVGDLGEDELKKERRLKAEARKKGERQLGAISLALVVQPSRRSRKNRFSISEAALSPMPGYTSGAWWQVGDA